ncbi:hypothetical protein jhhlp_006946 [Lomentospora prolificans]|uniref:OPT superfamily oligopeptide transporter n=1 Tax=Lomentospora prolificans TaxID=41688 RepID=A0A2N3N359_9PEZI|nr:hypothetical protein jhhlp_006946 [Lomentospora prolificans]
MSPDRGGYSPRGSNHDGGGPLVPFGRSFTLRGLLVGLLVGLVICFSNMYFGLQTGWVSPMTLPASLLGFGVFRLLSKHLDFPFSPVENVLVQTVAGSMALMPLGCGFVGVLPAMNYLLSPEEKGPIQMSSWKLIVWSLGLCYFGVVFAVPLTAVLIGVLHGQPPEPDATATDNPSSGSFASLVPKTDRNADSNGIIEGVEPEHGICQTNTAQGGSNIRLLLVCFAISGVLTLAMHFYPPLRNLPVFGGVAAQRWLWTLNPSLAYVGQGIIMGPETTLHMALGAFFGWAVLSPLAHYQGWAPGPVGDWDTGSKGWIVWISLSIMLSDAILNLVFVMSRPFLRTAPFQFLLSRFSPFMNTNNRQGQYLRVSHTDDEGILTTPEFVEQNHGTIESARNPLLLVNREADPDEQEDAPAKQQVSGRVIWVGLAASIVFCISSVHIVFGDSIPLYVTILAVAMALLLSVMGVRALGETDLNPVSGISKLAQLFFALVIPASNKATILINLISGAIGALQAGELMQDLKTGHLLGAAPKAQFWGQVIGATVGAIVSAFIYQLYTAFVRYPTCKYIS